MRRPRLLLLGFITALLVSEIQSFRNGHSVVTVPLQTPPCSCVSTVPPYCCRTSTSKGRSIPCRSATTIPSSLYRPQRELYTQLYSTGGGSNPESNDGFIIVGSLAILSIVTTALTVWSEMAVYQTGCGPLFLPDIVERISYQAVIFLSSIAWFIRIVFRQSLTNFIVEREFLATNDDDQWSILALRLAESLSYLSVVLAFIVVWKQVQDNVAMEGLSGINVEACRARRDLFLLW